MLRVHARSVVGEVVPIDDVDALRQLEEDTRRRGSGSIAHRMCEHTSVIVDHVTDLPASADFASEGDDLARAFMSSYRGDINDRAAR